nr:MAG TPA: hypothetical protein [Caudoviricetes sp.]
MASSLRFRHSLRVIVRSLSVELVRLALSSLSLVSVLPAYTRPSNSVLRASKLVPALSAEPLRSASKSSLMAV